MTRAPCCEKSEVKKGPWTPEEDALLVHCIEQHGEGNWSAVPKKAGLVRCGKSCRLRWANYLRPDLKRGTFTPEEEDHIIALHKEMGNRWAKIALELPGRTDNDIKNHWNTRIKRRLRDQGICPETHKPLPPTPEGAKQKPGTRKRHAAGEASPATKRTVVTPEVGPITLLHMPSEEAILHKFGLAMQAYWQSQANPGCADPGSPSDGCLSPTGLPQVFFDPTGGFGPLTHGAHGGCTSASAQAAAAEAATAAAELLCSSLQPRLAAKGAPAGAGGGGSNGGGRSVGGGVPEVCHEACCRSGGYPQLTPASPSKDHGDCPSGGNGGVISGAQAVVPHNVAPYSGAAANQRCTHGTPTEEDESVGESRELPYPGTNGEATPGKLPASRLASAMLEESRLSHQASFSSQSSSPLSMLPLAPLDSPATSNYTSPSPLHTHPLVAAGSHSRCRLDTPGTPQSAPGGASPGLRQIFHRCAESLQALGRGPTSGVPVVQPGLFLEPQECGEGHEQGEGEGEGVEGGSEGSREVPQGSCTGGDAPAAAAAGAEGEQNLSLGDQAPGAGRTPGAGHSSDSESEVAGQDVGGESSYMGLQLQIPSNEHGTASPFLLHQSSDASEVDLWTPGEDSGDLWSSDEDIDMAGVLISPSGPGSSHFKCLSALLGPEAVPESEPLDGGSSNSSSAGACGYESGNCGSLPVPDDMNCFNNLGDITPFDHAPSSPREEGGAKAEGAAGEGQGRAFPDLHCTQPAMMLVQ